MEVKNYKFWFCTGSQDLYGDECLAHVAEHSKIIVDALNKSGNLPYEVVWKPTMITNEVIRKTFNRAVGNAYPPPAGVPKLSHSRPIIPEIRGILLFWLIIKLMSVSNGSCRRMRIPGENSQAFFSVSSAESVSMYAE